MTSDWDYDHDPDFPFLVVDASHGPQGKFRYEDSAEAYAEGWLGFSVIDTRPVQIPRDVEFLMWGDSTEPHFARLVERNGNGERVWCTAGRGSELYDGDDSLILNAIGDSEITFLVKRDS